MGGGVRLYSPFCEYGEFLHLSDHKLVFYSTSYCVWHTLESIMDSQNVDGFVFDCIVLFKCA